MEEYGIKPEHRVVCFGQLLGMCDQVSFLLGKIYYFSFNDNDKKWFLNVLLHKTVIHWKNQVAFS